MDTTLLKGLVMLEVLADSEGERGISDLAVELRLTKSNIYRILNTLEAAGYVRRTSSSRYCLSLKIWEIGSKVLSKIDVSQVSKNAMKKLAAQTRETVHLSVLDKAEVIYIDKIDSPEPVRAYSMVGGRAPAYAVATGKVLLAFRSGGGEDPSLNIVKHTTKTVKNDSELQSELAKVRSQGFAINLGEWRETVTGLAAPIYGPDGVVVAAIGISGPASRLNNKRMKECVELVTEAAAEISTALGYKPSL